MATKVKRTVLYPIIFANIVNKIIAFHVDLLLEKDDSRS